MNKTIYNPKKFVNDLKKNKIPFILKKTLYTKKIISKYGVKVWNQKTDLTLKDLGFIMQVKNYCLKLNNIPKFIDRKKIFYINSNIKKSVTLKKDLYEIDLTGAYWELSYFFNYINKPIYEKGLTVPKKTRLIALGNLAKKTAVLEFNGEEFKPVTYEGSEKTQNIFFDVALYTDFIMRKAAVLAGKNYLFYWVDAIFIQGEETMQILSTWFTENNIKHKINKIDSLKNNKYNVVLVKDEKNGKEREREFNFQPPKRY